MIEIIGLLLKGDFCYNYFGTKVTFFLYLIRGPPFYQFELKKQIDRRNSYD